ncbi:MAG: hypothetical protein HYW65_01035 [Candidatus Liptonbacteria bacterium]|nr:hypothetical protein [Candidatus Liptonbacteria bacterium]
MTITMTKEIKSIWGSPTSLRKSDFLTLIAFAGLFILTSQAHAIGITVLPSELNVKTPRGTEAVARLTIQNPSREVAVFEVYPDDLDSLITPIPSRFTLESAESRTIEIKFAAKREGVYTTNLSVLARPLTDPLLGIGSGVKIPIIFTVTAPQTFALASLISLNSPWGLATIGIALAAILIYALRRAFQKRAAERY